MTSRIAALSRTVRVTAWPIDSPFHDSPANGASVTRPRVGLRPKRPQHDAGMRIDPPPSVACAAGTIPPATADAAPPLDPPDTCSAWQGLGHGPKNDGSVLVLVPKPGVFVFPTITTPARRSRATNSLSRVATASANRRTPFVVGRPATWPLRSLIK